MVARGLVLLVAALVLLVHDDETHIGERGEQRRARAHHHVGAALADHVPLIEALAGREARVQDGHVVSEAATKAPHRLRRERDLGDKHDGTAPARELALDGVEVDLGLARARDAVDEHDVADSRVCRPGDGGERSLLAVREASRPRRPRARERRRRACRATHAPAVLHGDHTMLEQGRHHGARPRHERRELRHALRARAERLDDALLALGVGTGPKRPALVGERYPAVIDGLGALGHERPVAALLARDAHGLAGWQHEAQAHGERRCVLAGNPGREASAHLVEGGGREDGPHRLHARPVHAGRGLLGKPHHVTHHVAVAKAHKDAAPHEAGLGQLGGHCVVKAPVDGAGGYVRNDARVSHGT